MCSLISKTLWNNSVFGDLRFDLRVFLNVWSEWFFDLEPWSPIDGLLCPYWCLIWAKRCITWIKLWAKTPYRSVYPISYWIYEIISFENYNLKAENNIEYSHKRNKSREIHFRWNDKDVWSLYLVKSKTRFQIGRCFCGSSKGIQIWHQLDNQMHSNNVNGSLRDCLQFWIYFAENDYFTNDLTCDSL